MTQPPQQEVGAVGKSHIWAWQAPEDLGHSDLLPNPGEQDHTRFEAGLALPMFPSHQILGTNSSGHPFQKVRAKGQVQQLLHWKRGLGQHSHQLLATWDPESFLPHVPASIPKDSLISKLPMPREENIYLKPGGQIQMTTTMAQRARPLGLG